MTAQKLLMCLGEGAAYQLKTQGITYVTTAVAVSFFSFD
jgi:hypothetical protein